MLNPHESNFRIRSRPALRVLAALGLFIGLLLPDSFASPAEFLLRWGTWGCDPGQFVEVMGIAVGPSGAVYVSDQSCHSMQKFDPFGGFQAHWTGSGLPNGEFNEPTGVAVDRSECVYVVDEGNSRIQKFDSNGVFIVSWGSEGNSDGQFQYPSGIAVDGARNVFVSEAGVGRIQKFDSAGRFLTKWGSSGKGPGQFDSPYLIATDPLGNVYIADYGNHRIQKFNNCGRFLAQWGNVSSAPEQLIYPADLAFAGPDRVYVTEGTMPPGVKLFALDNPPSLRLTLAHFAPGQLTLSWPTNDPSSHLEMTDSLAPASQWQAVTNLSTVAAGNYQVVLPTPNTARFYRCVCAP